VNQPLTNAQRAIFRSVGGQLVQHKSQARKGALADHQIRPTDDNAFRVSGARKIGIWLKNSFDQARQRRLANYLSIGVEAAKDEVMSPRKSIQPAHQLARSAVETSARRTRASSAEMGKPARLNSKRFRRPAATPIGEPRYAKKMLSV